MCPVQSALNIVQRAIRLRVPADDPIAVYKRFPNSKTYTHITKRVAQRYVRESAVTAYQLNETEAKKYTLHSLRIGACVLLHAMGFQPMDIKFLLRWRSDAFLTYLRMFTGLADRHVRALNRAMGMPHLF